MFRQLKSGAACRPPRPISLLRSTKRQNICWRTCVRMMFYWFYPPETLTGSARMYWPDCRWRCMMLQETRTYQVGAPAAEAENMTSLTAVQALPSLQMGPVHIKDDQRRARPQLAARFVQAP